MPAHANGPRLLSASVRLRLRCMLLLLCIELRKLVQPLLQVLPRVHELLHHRQRVLRRLLLHRLAQLQAEPREVVGAKACRGALELVHGRVDCCIVDRVLLQHVVNPLQGSLRVLHHIAG